MHSLQPLFPLFTLLAVYVALQCLRLAETPLLNPDEAAYTEPAWTLLTTGRFGAPMYAGLLAIDTRWYFLWPGYGVLATLPYALWGVDVLSVRRLSALFGAILLAAEWLLVRQVPAGHPRDIRGTAAEPKGADPLPSDRTGQGPGTGHTAWKGPRRADAIALGAVALTLIHPTVLFLSRFGRPEIAVAAFAVISSALAARADRCPARGKELMGAAGAGVAAALSFLMHQYGAFALAALALGLVWRPVGEWRRAWPLALAAAGGAVATLVPWILWVGADWPEFRAQLAVQLAYQQWRYPEATLLTSLIGDLPGRYVLNRQDFPPGWQPWAEAVASLLGPHFLQGPPGPAPLPLARWIVAVPLYWGQIGVAGLYRWSVLAALLAAVVAVPFTHRRDPAVLRWVVAPLLVWVIGLAAIPNKWEGYTGAVSAYVAIGVALLFAASWPPEGRRSFAAIALVACATLWLAADARLLAQPVGNYARFAARLRAVVPAGEPVTCSMREWFAFAGRNPAVTYEFRSVPAFGTSVLQMIAEQRPRYLVLHRRPDAANPASRYYFIDPPDAALYAYLDDATTIVATVADATFGTVEVRRVLAYPR